jgi:hypothetical protein
MMGEYLTICPKVALGDIFFVTRPNENRSAYNRINRKHVDFLICDPKTMKPRFAIELDDSSHQRQDREERDEFVDGVFHAANLPLIHVPAQSTYNTSELGFLFKRALQGSSTPLTDSPVSNAASSSTKTSEIPLCPKCGAPMVRRAARQGDQAGKPFWGCSNYPKCRTIVPINE